jgi:hypothetical protein
MNERLGVQFGHFLENLIDCRLCHFSLFRPKDTQPLAKSQAVFLIEFGEDLCDDHLLPHKRAKVDAHLTRLTVWREQRYQEWLANPCLSSNACMQ